MSSSPFSSSSLEGKLQRLAPSGGSSRAFLLVVEGPRAGRLHLLGDQEMLIGRGEAVDIDISDPAVSHEHARITRREDGFYLVDMGSRNGTLLNGVLISERKLRKRDRIHIGETTLVFLEEGAAEATMTVHIPRHDGAVQRDRSAVESAGRAIHTELTVQPENPVFDLIRKTMMVLRFIRRNALVLLPPPLIGLALGFATMKLMPAPEVVGASVKLTHDRAINPVDPLAPYDPRRELPAFFAEPEKNFANPELARSTLLAMGVEPNDDNLGRAASGLHFERDTAAATGVYSASFSQPSNPPPTFSSTGYLDRYLETYLLHEVDKSIRGLKSEAAFLENELQEADGELAEVEAELLKIRNQNIDSLPEQAGAVLEGKLELETERSRAEIEVKRLHVEVANLRQQVKQAGKAAPIRTEELRALRLDLGEQNRKLSDLKAKGLKADHPDVREVTSRITTLERNIKTLMNSEVTEVERNTDPRLRGLQDELMAKEGALRVAETALGSLNAQLADANDKVVRLPGVEAKVRSLSQRQEQLQRHRARLFEKHQEKRVQIDLETANVKSRYEIVNPATVMNPVTKKFLIKRLGGGAGVGLLVGLLAAGLLELRRLVRRHPELLKA